MLTTEDHVRVFDTTLRDGEQTPGVSLDNEQKLEIAQALARLGVDIIETGFPATSEQDWKAVRGVAETVGCSPDTPSGRPPTICALARTTPADIERAWGAISVAHSPRIHTFVASSDVHLKHKLRMSRQMVLERVAAMVSHARGLCEDIEFSAEDASRSDPEFLLEVFETAVAAGATTLNIPDTVGYSTPDEYAELVRTVVRGVAKKAGAVVSVHCHDDLGLATANTLAGVRAGARQVEVTLNGLGERAGNAPLEEVVMALETRRDTFGFGTGIDTSQIAFTSMLVARCSGVGVPPNKAVVGANAFAHESGIHQDGVLKHRETYEIMNPAAVGAGSSRLVLGKHSGRHAVRARLAQLGHQVDGEALDQIFRRFKQLTETTKQVTDQDLESLLNARKATA